MPRATCYQPHAAPPDAAEKGQREPKGWWTVWSGLVWLALVQLLGVSFLRLLDALRKKNKSLEPLPSFLPKPASLPSSTLSVGPGADSSQQAGELGRTLVPVGLVSGRLPESEMRSISDRNTLPNMTRCLEDQFKSEWTPCQAQC